ncbi:MAG: helix-turn-helix domain-containing protein [Acetobacter sp.]|nr:helix-turn-helix domain-containing protein [Bacteroides sp.]MCM1342032.1 helix-turn-helix domain-containing protein [Acetobacter sp.]MCM1434240.1 helix-turn-helix domain-containing protein [Clostridiales bacterium]
MDWTLGLQNAINYIEENLTEDIDYERVASESGFSNFYFQRIFGVLCGCSFGEYIRNRRLTLAGNELSSANKKVIDTALKYSYDPPESFARAFSKFHGISSDAIQQTWHKVCAEFFLTSAYKPTYEMDIETYTAGEMSSPDYKSEIWVPIEENN